MKKKARARRQRIPAFGEWNYAYVDGGAGDWSAAVTDYFESGVQAGRLVMPMPPRAANMNKVVKWREGATPTLEAAEDDEKEKQRQQHVVVVGLGDHGGAAMRKQGTGKKQQQRTVVHAYEAMKQAIDQDLYHIPPDMLCHEPRKRLTRRSLWMGCLGLSCVA